MMNKKYIFLILTFLAFSEQISAHYLWIETNSSGEIGSKQDVKVFFGEYAHGLYEVVGDDAFNRVKKFKVWVIDPKGDKTELSFESAKNHYLSSFTPTIKGTYTLALNNNEIDVIDYSKYDFGIFKTHYHAIAKVNVKNSTGATSAINSTGITIVDHSKNVVPLKGDELKLQVLYKGKPLVDNELIIFVADQWSKELTTDENGEVSFKLPWGTKYVVEVSTKEEEPSRYNGKDYEFIYHAVTYCIDASKN